MLGALRLYEFAEETWQIWLPWQGANLYRARQDEKTQELVLILEQLGCSDARHKGFLNVPASIVPCHSLLARIFVNAGKSVLH